MAPICESLPYLIDHIFLPSKLPGGDDCLPERETALLSAVIDALVTWKQYTKPICHGQVNVAISMLRNMQQIHSKYDGSLIEGEVLRLLKGLTEGDTIPLYIREQNAGVLISRHDCRVSFEVFEIWSTNDATMTTKGRLRRSFPGAGVDLGISEFQQPGLQETIAHTLAGMSNHSIEAMQPKANKAGNSFPEARDTAHPGMVSESFIGFLRSIGHPTDCPAIVKNMRDDVLHCRATTLPWRRSPWWLLIRVSLQLEFNRMALTAKSDTIYKEAMLFIMCHVLVLATKQSVASDLLYSMNAKLARRLFKIGPDLDGIHHIQGAMRDTHAIISKSWSETQELDARELHLFKLPDLDFINDSYVSLPDLDQYIAWMNNWEQKQMKRTFNPSSTLKSFTHDVLPQLAQLPSDNTNIIANLAAFEEWVALHSRNWSRNNQSSACLELGPLIASYHQLALHHYSQNPEALSTMLLTIFELWVALDVATVGECPLLDQYKPGVPSDVLQNALLPFVSQMERLRHVENHLFNRSLAQYSSTELYYNLDSPKCFPVRFFDDSPELQQKREDIIKDAGEKRQAKQRELQKLRINQAELLKIADSKVCEYESFLYPYPKTVHLESSCTKCSIRACAENLKIQVHEWPLPESDAKQKAVVFELNIPACFQSWRQATFYLLRDVIGMQYTTKSCPDDWEYKLFDDPHLRHLRSSPLESDIGLLSEKKPQIFTHRKEQKVSVATDDSIFVHNGLDYHYYDAKDLNFVETFKHTETVLNMCTYRLPSCSGGLQKYLYRPHTSPDGPDPNLVLANQFETPGHMSLEEAGCLAMLPLGHHIQFHNILVQLAAPSIDLRKEETALFVFQCLYQAGPSGTTTLRDGHDVADDEGFALCLLENVRAAWQRVKGNWESIQALGMFAAITARLLSLTSLSSVQEDCLKLLGTLRAGAFAWVEHLREKSHNAILQDDTTYFKMKSVDIALVCTSCFDVEQRYLSRILESEADASIFVQCSILIQEGKRVYDPASDLIMACLSLRFQRLLYRSSAILSATHLGISDAVKKAWSEYPPTGSWRLACNTTHWLVTEPALDNGQTSLQVHYDLLSGELLVNGIPLGRPPREYEDSPIWQTLFGQAAIEVMPTSAVGMHFSAKRQYKGHNVCLGMESDLLVQAYNSTSATSYNLIPARLFRGIFPGHFINDFVHWYNRKNNTVEFRPSTTPWELTDAAWILSESPDDKLWTLKRKDSVVLGVESPTAKAIAHVLIPLADKLNIHTLLQLFDRPFLEVEIPALRFGFFLNSGESNLRSREFPGMLVDENQSLGTLIGLENKLVLRNDDRRLVLVPESEVVWRSTNGHVKVTVEKNTITGVHALQIDELLGRLVDNGNLQCKLFISYLHALTSNCLPDPLTKKTGVEQALSTLNSAAVRSFDRLSEQNIEIVEKIAQLNPTREYYPQSSKVMQVVTWLPGLSHLSQHDGFFEAACAIYEQAEQMSLFYPGSGFEHRDLCVGFNTDKFLIERDAIRSSTFRVSGFGAEAHTTAHDLPYRGRDSNQLGSNLGANAYILSRMIYRQCTTLHTAAPQSDQLWEAIKTTPKVLGPHAFLPLSQLKYSPQAAKSGLDLSEWLVLHRILSSEPDVAAHKFNIMIWLSTIAAHEHADMSLLQVVALFFTAQNLKDIALPDIHLCCPPKGYKATSELLEDSVRSHAVPYPNSPEGKCRPTSEDHYLFYRFSIERYSYNLDAAVRTLTSQLLREWPRERLPALGHVDSNISNYISVSAVETDVSEQFENWFNNLRLFKYFEHIGSTLSDFSCKPHEVPGFPQVSLTPATRSRTFASVQDFLAATPPLIPITLPTFKLVPTARNEKLQAPRLEGLLGDLKEMPLLSRHNESYIRELENSMEALMEQKSELHLDLPKYNTTSLHQHLDACKKDVDELYSSLVEVVTSKNPMSEFELGPRISPSLFLQQLSKKSWPLLSPSWQEFIACYGLALSDLQMAERLVKTARSQNMEDLKKELANIGHESWDPINHPEWLLLEVESGITIRRVQELVASEMIHPHSLCNATMQLNMGEGKSSVIVPMVAAELADGSQLVRVIVGKPQSKQMMQMLTSKLGGLLDRRVYHMPFSRSLNIASEEMAATIDTMLKDCKESGGILLVQPEHLLSFQLMGLECYNHKGDAKVATGNALISIQDFFDMNSRDIVDESDENFSPKFELIYTMGTQQSVELSPNRWVCIQQVLGCVRSVALDIADRFPQSIDIRPPKDGGFLRLRVLKADAGKLLVEKVARRICDQGLDNFQIARQQGHVREAVFKYITQHSLTREDINAVEETGNGGFFTESTKPLLFLLRGILADGVLLYALGQKRWRVNYGLSAARIPPTKLAVPYRAKDNPTPRSEFSHPDVTIMLTCLTYYYGGLGDEDLFIALGHLMASDQADIEYDAWMKDSPNMPASFRQLEGINLNDRPQCVNDVFPYLKYGKNVVDYFLGNIVFPKELMAFPYKLSASGWDLGKKKAHYTTGFSGTNDSSILLPLDMKHLNLKSQSHTNALVLEYLLRPENSVTFLPDHHGAGTDANRFLATVVSLTPPTRVILDVGAQILELSNQEVAESWLQMVTDTRTQAAVFVNDDDELFVVDRRGRLEPLQISSYATRLDCCLVFLDEAHTRGIDLKLPEDYRAAVTLGANLTKDRLVQACMRMRKLGKGQSVVFCASAEIRAKIEELTGDKPGSDVIGVKDVLRWAISETFSEIKRTLPLWAVQGNRFLHKEELWRSAQSSGSTSITQTLAQQFLEVEARSIEDRYRPCPEELRSIADQFGTGCPRSNEITKRCNEFDDLHTQSSTLEEEQERELSPELERETQIQLPPPIDPANHSLHDDVVEFVTKGHLLPTSKAYMEAFHALRDTSAAQHFDLSQFKHTKLFVTADFAKTVIGSSVCHVSDSYLRPVQWVLSHHAKGSGVIDALMIISPYEAERVVSMSKKLASEVTIHLYKPRCQIGHHIFDNLDFFTIPHRPTRLEIPDALQVQLNLFAGQLYFKAYDDYLGACEFLGLAADVPKEGEIVDSDGYISRSSNGGGAKFRESPIRFFRVFTSKIRRNGQDIAKTHAGAMFSGKLLLRSDIVG